MRGQSPQSQRARYGLRIRIFVNCLGAVFCLFFLFSAAGIQAAEKAPAFTLCTARPALNTVVLRGYTRARWRRDLVCEESGRCLEVFGEMGDVIGADGLFAEIDTTFIDLALKVNQAACGRLQNQTKYWRHEVDRYRNLSGQKVVSEKKVLDLEQKFDQAKLALAELKVKAEVLAERRRRCRISAPENWLILKRLVEPGEWLTVGRTVAVVADYSTLLVPFSLTMAQYKWVKKEAQAKKLKLKLAAPTDAVSASAAIPARLLHVSPAFDLVSRKIAVELEIDEGLAEKRGGIALELAVELPEPGNVVAVPAAAMVERYGTFWLIRADGSEVKVVKLGRTSAGDLKVAGDKIKPGDSFRCF